MGLICGSCQFDNDPTRVYCHNCGQRLDRGGAVAPPPTGFTHPTELRNLRRPRTPIAWGRLFGGLLRLAFLIALVAAVVLAALEPPGVPPPVAADQPRAAALSALVSDAAHAASPRAFQVSAADLQQWLVSTVELGSAPVLVAAMKPERIYAVPGNDSLRLGLKIGLPFGRVYYEADYRPEKSGNGYSLQPLGYRIGRLELPPVLGWPVARQFEGLRDALQAPLGELSRASRIAITPEAVMLQWSGTVGN